MHVITFSLFLGLIGGFVNAKVPQPLAGFSKKNPGAIFTLTTAGVDYMIGVTENVWNRVAKDLHLDKTTVDLTTPVIGTLTLKNLRTVGYDGPSFAAELQPDILNVKATDFKKLNLAAYMDLKLPQFGVQITGPVAANLSDIVIDMDIKLGTNPNTMSPKVRLPKCQFTMKTLVLDMDRLTGSKLLKDEGLKATIQEKAKKYFGIEFCKKVKSSLVDQLNSQLQTLITKKNMKSSRRQNPYTDYNFQVLERQGIPATQLDSVNPVDAGRFIVDNTYLNTDQPSIQPGSIRSLHNSLVNLPNSGDIPFNPPPIGNLRDASMQKHMYAQLSDFTVNSMLYSSHKENLLDAKVVGSGGISVSQTPRGVSDAACPFVTVQQNRINLYYDGKVETTNFGSKKSSIRTNSIAVGEVVLTSTGSVVKADAKITNFRLNGGEIDELTATDNNDLTSITKTILEKFTDDGMARSVPVPDSKFGKMKDVTVNLSQDRVIELGINMDLKEDALVKEANDYIAENFR